MFGSRSRVRSSVLLGSLLAGTAALAAQQSFRTTSNVVAVEATVVDKSGKPVTDLTAADFQIFEDGKAQPVETIYLVTTPPKNGPTSKLSSPETAAPGTSAPGTGAPAHLLTRAPGFTIGCRTDEDSDNSANARC